LQAVAEFEEGDRLGDASIASPQAKGHSHSDNLPPADLAELWASSGSLPIRLRKI
jgi:hypothetical protein